MCVKKGVFLLLLLFSNTLYCQLDDTHYFPPLKDIVDIGGYIERQMFYFSTPEKNEFKVFVYRGTSETPILILENLSNANPLKHSFGNGVNDIAIVSDSNTGVVVTNSGLRFVSENGEKFYVNYRCKSLDHAGSLTCKGKKALGTNFRWGGIPSGHAQYYLNNYMSIVASEDNTIVRVSNFDRSCAFRQQDVFVVPDNDFIEVTLNKNECYVLESISGPDFPIANLNGWLGADVESSKPIAVSCGGFVSYEYLKGDLAIDQIVPVDVIGQQYGFIRGNGDDITEFPLLVGTKDNTQIFVNGNYHATIDDGDYIKIPGSLYSGQNGGANLFVETNKKVYAYQCLTGEVDKVQTLGMNFIPPLVCLLPNSFDQISEIEDIAGTTSKTSAITIIADKKSLNEDIKVFENDILVDKPDPLLFSGNDDWKSFFINNLTGDVRVESTGSIVVGFFVNDGGNAGFAGYFSGFDLVPDTEVELVLAGECLPDGYIQLKDTIRPSYQWYKDGVEMPGKTSYKVQIDGVGEYSADIITASGCVYKSESIDIEDPDRGVLFDTCIPNRTIITKDTLQSGYQWYLNDSLLKNETNYRLDSLVPGVYHTDIITSAGCVYKSDEYLVLDDIPDTKIDSVYIGSGCINDGVIKLFKKDENSYYDYQWYRGNLPIPFATSNEYIVKSEGGYYVDIITPDGCVIVSDTISIQPPSKEIIRDPIYGCAPNGNLRTIDTLQMRYQWYRNDVKISGATDFRVSLDSIGVYYADITTYYGCTHRSDSLEVIHCYDLEVAKTANKAEILEGGDDVTYSIDVLNKGYLPVTSLNIYENIPNEMTYQSHSATKGSWVVSSSVWDIGTLDAGEKTSLLLNTKSLINNDTLPITNLIQVDFKETDSEYSPDDLTETIHVINGEIEITDIKAKLERPYRIIRGDVLNFTFTVKNVGNILLDNIHLRNNIFEGELNEAYVSGDVNNNRVLDFDEAWVYKASYNITQGEINRLQVVSLTTVNGRQSNAFYQEHEKEYVYHIDPEFVVPYIDLALILTGNGPKVYVDDEVRFNLNLTSDHVADVTDLSISAPLPSGFVYRSYSSEKGIYNAIDGIWTIDRLEKESDTNLEIKATMLIDGDDNTLYAEIQSFHELDSITDNNFASLTIDPRCNRVFNEFTPNDDGINDYLVIQCSELSNNIGLKIFSRTGVLVYESTNYQNEFNGYGNRGVYVNKNKKLPNGTYFYTMSPHDGTGSRKGWIYINR